MPSNGQRISLAAPLKSRLFEVERSAVFTKHVCHLELGPHQEIKVSLGSFSVDNPAKGFSIECTPETEHGVTIEVRIIYEGSAKHYELILYATNPTDAIIQTDVWQMR